MTAVAAGSYQAAPEVISKQQQQQQQARMCLVVILSAMIVTVPGRDRSTSSQEYGVVTTIIIAAVVDPVVVVVVVVDEIRPWSAAIILRIHSTHVCNGIRDLWLMRINLVSFFPFAFFAWGNCSCPSITLFSYI